MMSDLYQAVSDDEIGTEVIRVKLVEPCEHSNYARHIKGVLDNFERVWCDGKPKEVDDES